MNIRIGIFGFILWIALLPSWVCGQEKVYTVKKGETFYSIAQTLGIRADDLMKYNGITDPMRLQEGQRLRVPGGETRNVNAAPPAPAAGSGVAEYTVYRVVRGDTFYSIARKFSVTVDQIRKANSLTDRYVLREGDSLRIPSENAPKVAAQSPALQGRIDPRETETRTVNASVSWPVTVRELSYMTGKLSGVVITGQKSESVKSLTWGTVLSAGPFQGFGRVVIIQVEGGYLYVYGGCENLSVKEGDKVSPGTELGKLGLDAISGKPQLFFMVYRSNTPVDPAKAPRA